MMRQPRRLLFGILAAGFLAAGLTACGSSTSSSSTSTTTATVPVSPQIATATVVINGKTVNVPREEFTPTLPINGQVDNGLQIILTKKSPLPLELYTPASPTVTWTNLTAETLRVHIVIPNVVSGSIAPGGHWSYHFTQGSSAGYVVSTGYTGQIAIDQLPLPPLPTTTTGG